MTQDVTAQVETDIKCPHAKTAMTPCYLRDGDLAVAKRENGWGADVVDICVGCEFSIGLLQSDFARRQKGHMWR